MLTEEYFQPGDFALASLSALEVLSVGVLLEYWTCQAVDRIQDSLGELFTTPRGEATVESSDVKRIFDSGASLNNI